MKKPSGGCARAREEIVAFATALGASVLQAERFFICGERCVICAALMDKSRDMV